MKIKDVFFRLLNGFENLFMKNHSCICCYKEISDETRFMLCENCNKNMEILSGKLCEKCGDFLNDKGDCINSCNKLNYCFDKNISIFYYTNSAARIVKNLKYGKKKYLAENIANIMVEYAKDFISDVDIILHVPASKNRIRERGFNQAKELAKFVAEKTNKKLIDAILKIKDTIHQAGGSQKERMKNLVGSFAIDEIFADELKGKNILIIDDVFTTGSTLNECAKIIKNYKPKSIKTLTFAKTKFNLSQIR